MLTEIPETSTDSWSHGELFVSLNDSVLQGSSAFRAAAQWMKTLDGRRPILLTKRTDGGGEQNTENGVVRLADIAVFRKSKTAVSYTHLTLPTKRIV